METYIVIPIELFLMETENMTNLFINYVKKQERNFGNYWREIQVFKQPEGTCIFDLNEILLMWVEFTSGFHSYWPAQWGLLTLI